MFWNLIWDLANQSPLCGIQSLINGFQVDIGLGKVEGELYSWCNGMFPAWALNQSCYSMVPVSDCSVIVASSIDLL